METARQVVRFSIPGSVYLMTVGSSLAVVALGVGHPVGEVARFFAPNDGTTAAIVAALLGTLGLGFMLYQAYYFYLGRVIVVRNVVVSDRAGELVADIPAALRRLLDPRGEAPGSAVTARCVRIRRVLGLRVLVLVPARRTKAERARYARLVNQHLSLVKASLDAIALRLPEAKSEYTVVSDLYHSLGACRVAVMCGVLTAAAVAPALPPSRVGTLLPTVAAFAAVLLVAFVVCLVLAGNRRRAWFSARESLRYNLRHYGALPAADAATEAGRRAA